MADPRADVIRIQQNFDILKDNPAFKHFLTMGGRPRIEETGLDPATYGKFIEALEYGQSITQDMNEEMATGLGGIDGVKAKTSTNPDGSKLIELAPEEDDDYLPSVVR